MVFRGLPRACWEFFSSIKMEFQAIVLADHDDGSGTRLYPLLEKTPKSLLPIAGRPLIAYQLALLERSGFKEVGGCALCCPVCENDDTDAFSGNAGSI